VPSALRYGPHAADNLFTDVLDRSRKYVASRTLREPCWCWGGAADRHAQAALLHSRGAQVALTLRLLAQPSA